jgi:RNA polymerase sigma factor (sigma-70 family)
VIPSDLDLIARVLVHDDRAAFGELVQRHQSAVRGFLRQLTSGDHALADDLAQETFLHAHRRLADYRGDARFSTWLCGIAHNHFRNARRSLSRSTPQPALPELPDEHAPSPARMVALHEDLTAALAQLEHEQQTALHLFYQQGLTHPEIAMVAGWPLGTVKTHLARGKDKLRQLLSAWNPST